jgi:hypothetical protein
LSKRIKNLAGQVTIDADRCQQNYDWCMVEVDLLHQALWKGEEKIHQLEERDCKWEEKFSKLWEVVLDMKCRTMKVEVAVRDPLRY